MQINFLVHDYAGHPFEVRLSPGALACRAHQDQPCLPPAGPKDESEMVYIKTSRNQELIELRKSGWTFRRIAKKYHITRADAGMMFSRWATEDDKRVEAAVSRHRRTTLIVFRIKPDLERCLRAHLKALGVTGAGWLEDKIEESMRDAKSLTAEHADLPKSGSNSRRSPSPRSDSLRGPAVPSGSHAASAAGREPSARNEVAKAIPSRAQEVIELRKAGWTNQRIADECHISGSYASYLFSCHATAEEKSMVAALRRYPPTTLARFRIMPDLRRRFRKHLRKLGISPVDWLEDKIEESIRDAVGS